MSVRPIVMDARAQWRNGPWGGGVRQLLRPPSRRGDLPRPVRGDRGKGRARRQTQHRFRYSMTFYLDHMGSNE